MPTKAPSYPTWTLLQALAWYRENTAPQVTKAEAKRGEAALKAIYHPKGKP